MIEKRTVLDQIEIRPNGVVLARFMKQIVEDGNVLIQEPHRASFEPGCDVVSRMYIVNLHLLSMGCATVNEYEQLKDHVTLAHTTEVLAAYKTDQEKKKE